MKTERERARREKRDRERKVSGVHVGAIDYHGGE